jgi:hypothetical protein
MKTITKLKRKDIKYGLIDESEVSAARKAGLLLHHEVKTQDFGGESVVVRDDWYAATPEFVASYCRSGGMWGYND